MTKVGLAVGGSTAQGVLADIERAEQKGIDAVWMTTGGARLDSLTVFAAAALRTERIKFGTSIVPTYPRHPLVMAQQVQVIDQLAPGRFRLGVGPSHRPTMRQMGIRLDQPLGHLREYLQVLKALLQEGKVDLDGDFYQAHEAIPQKADVPIMASALQRGSFELCGAEADGAISWVCPWSYLENTALPAMKEGAAKAGRAAPPLIAHAPVCVHDDVDEVREAFREQFSNYPRLPFYRRMLVSSGYPEASNSTWSDAMIDGLVLYGNEEHTASHIRKLLDSGASEILVSPVLAGNDREASLDRTLTLLGQVSQAVAA